MSNEKIYCRVDNGKVIEYPVTEAVILKRRHPIDWYTPTILTHVPATGRTDIQTFDYVITNGVVLVNVGWRGYTLTELLTTFKAPNGLPKHIGEISQEDQAYAQSLISDLFESRVADLAAEHGYRNMDTAIGRYSNSSNATFKKEAEFIQMALDSTWADLIKYFTELQKTTIPVPLVIADIEKHVRSFNWPVG